MEATIGERFAVVRRVAGLSLMQLAHELGIDKSTLHRCERGEFRLDNARIASLVKLAKLDAPTSAWIAFGGEKPRELVKAEKARAAEAKRAKAS